MIVAEVVAFCEVTVKLPVNVDASINVTFVEPVKVNAKSAEPVTFTVVALSAVKVNVSAALLSSRTLHS